MIRWSYLIIIIPHSHIVSQPLKNGQSASPYISRSCETLVLLSNCTLNTAKADWRLIAEWNVDQWMANFKKIQIAWLKNFDTWNSTLLLCHFHHIISSSRTKTTCGKPAAEAQWTYQEAPDHCSMWFQRWAHREAFFQLHIWYIWRAILHLQPELGKSFSTCWQQETISRGLRKVWPGSCLCLHCTFFKDIWNWSRQWARYGGPACLWIDYLDRDNVNCWLFPWFAAYWWHSYRKSKEQPKMTMQPAKKSDVGKQTRGIDFAIILEKASLTLIRVGFRWRG